MKKHRHKKRHRLLSPADDEATVASKGSTEPKLLQKIPPAATLATHTSDGGFPGGANSSAPRARLSAGQVAQNRRKLLLQTGEKRAPTMMTPDEYDKEQSEIRRVYDPESGRVR
jgi:hypothetical protein